MCNTIILYCSPIVLNENGGPYPLMHGFQWKNETILTCLRLAMEVISEAGKVLVI